MCRALSLKNEMTKTYDEFEGMFPIVDGLDLGELLNEATYHIEQTEIYTGDQELEESVESIEQTLRKLVQLYALMQQLEKQKAQGQGQGQPSDSQGKQGSRKKSRPKKQSGSCRETGRISQRTGGFKRAGKTTGFFE